MGGWLVGGWLGGWVARRVGPEHSHSLLLPRSSTLVQLSRCHACYPRCMRLSWSLLARPVSAQAAPMPRPPCNPHRHAMGGAHRGCWSSCRPGVARLLRTAGSLHRGAGRRHTGVRTMVCLASPAAGGWSACWHERCGVLRLASLQLTHPLYAPLPTWQITACRGNAG